MKATLTQEFEARLEEKVEEKLQERIEERLEQRVAMEVKAYLTNLLPQMTGDVKAFQGMQVMTNMEATQNPRVIEVDTKCRLALKDEYNQNLVVVADGILYPVTGEVTHNLKMLPDHYRISVDNPYPDCALLDIPVPSPDGMTKLGKAKSSIVLWPIDMVFLEEEVSPSPKKKHRSRQSKEGDDSCGVKSRQTIKPTKFLPLEDKIVDTFGEGCELLYWLMNSDDAKYDTTLVLLKASMFNFDSDKQIWVTATDVREFLRGSWANVSLIHVYIMYLVDNFIDLFNRTEITFFCPQLISESSIENDYLETYTYVKNTFLHEVRKTGKRCKFTVAPYVASGHWVLVVVDLQLGLAYEFDSMNLPKENPRKLKIAEIMMTAYKVYRANLKGSELKSQRQKLKFIQMECAQQQGGVERGYYIMRYMYEIVTSHSECKGVLEEDFCPRTAPYDGNELNVVREQWAQYFRSKYLLNA
ncbi:uncharacterized protein LOC110710949 [Chenopodium quinoa]|uniref:uncharacterized protein LOC110710949 n=1 Tax=Chenopodium quinoa TaxID=63459 RepID=UPI000B795240|nr:uncharacterized protein LOC110710949 [Chenopodium quinoa]